MTGCYEIPAVTVSVRGARTDKVPTGPYRGAGPPEAAYLLECTVDLAAHRLGLHPVELRRRNLIRSFPHRNPMGFTYDSGDYARCLDLALELLGDEREPAGDDGRVVSAPASRCTSSAPGATGRARGSRSGRTVG